MPFFLRAFSALNGAREWFSFARETFSWLGLAKRAAAAVTVAAAGAAVVAVPSVMTVDPARTAAQATRNVPAAEVEIDASQLYSKLYLVKPEHRAMLDAIIEKCEGGAEISVGQCDIAEDARRLVRLQEQDAALLSAISRVRAEQKAANVKPLKLPHEIQIVR